jgi:hypothetical protein
VAEAGDTPRSSTLGRLAATGQACVRSVMRVRTPPIGDKRAPLRPGPPGGRLRLMTIGASLFFIAVGAILKFAVRAEVAGVELETVGVILMVIGGLGLVLAWCSSSWRRALSARPAPDPHH